MMYYMSRVEIDKENRRKISDLTHLGAYHNWVERSYPSEFEKGERSRKLWRTDQLKGKTYLVIVSQLKPCIEKLEKYGVPGTGECKSYDAFLENITNNSEMLFRLTANPVRAVKQNDIRGKVYPHITIEHQLGYLEKRSERLGFRLMENDYNIIERDFPSLRKNGKTIRLARVTYEGSLIVTNAEQFYKTLTEGVGREKAYGFGLMTVIHKSKTY